IKNINTLPDSKKYITLKNEIGKAILSRELAALKNNIPVKFEYFITKSDNINEFFQEFGFKSLMNRNV
ncbi:MAG: hypothetical protein LBU35_03240, partial [Holosporales bacterium]|nr:hypothetical protein [Holosporales bacterium]